MEDPLTSGTDACQGRRPRRSTSTDQNGSSVGISTAELSTALSLQAYESLTAELLSLTLGELAAELDDEARHGGQYGPGLALAALILRDRASETVTQSNTSDLAAHLQAVQHLGGPTRRT